MKKLLIIFLLFAATASANVIRPVEPSAAENNMVRLSRIIIDKVRRLWEDFLTSLEIPLIMERN